MKTNHELIGKIRHRIFLIREHRVMLDSDLAEIYAVPPKRLNEQVRRNLKRFPSDFMFQLNEKEYESLRSQIATLKKRRGKHRKYLPFVFTEQGIAMLSSVLHSERAILANIEIMRAFVRLKKMTETNEEFIKRIRDIEQKLTGHDQKFKVVFKAIEQMLLAGTPPVPKKIRH